MYSLIIGGDLFPSYQNYKKFIDGDINSLFGLEFVELFANSDYTICNLEGALTNSEKEIPKIGPNIKYSPDVICAYKKLGVDCLLTANNHVTDYGEEGYIDTINELEKSNIDFIGSSTYGKKLQTHININAGGKSVCIYNVAETMFNTYRESSVIINLYDEYSTCKEIAQLRKACDYMIVLYHGGIEKYQYPSIELKKRFHRMADNGADLVIAQHTHCIGCEEIYNNSRLIYGQGNFLFARMSSAISQQGFLLEIQFGDEVIIKKHLYKVDVINGCIDTNVLQNWLEYDERGKKIGDDMFLRESLMSFSEKEMSNIIKPMIPKGKFRAIIYKIIIKLLFLLYHEEEKRKVMLNILHMLRSEQKNETMQYYIYKKLQKYD